MIINHNISAMNAYRNLQFNDVKMGKTMEKLSSGYRINRAADDAAGLAISEKMRAQITGLNQAIRNAQDGISLVQSAEGALTEVHSMLNRMRELAVQAANDTNTDEDRAHLNAEVTELINEINRIGSQTEFNEMQVLNGSFDASAGGTAIFHIGPNANQTINVNVASMNANAIGSTADVANLAAISISTQSNAEIALDSIDTAINQISQQRAKLGAVQNRLEHTVNNLNVTKENLQAAESRIRDADMAAEMMKFTKQQILVQAGTAMLAQANAKPQAVLQLLG
ncbi:flagellin [Halothermothrix orenii]|uniref:Flagellin n=1 Tax=Halothermothrix orenii (strain H 168 / OCM 544 / DSM 9562) TaxID=373903 RepID=B8CYT8_HALOH|nr:flagellin [Halothermothrix orenii]ACL70457.1 flagellin domain protein [Halothermothrix orenii H 168]